MADYPYIMGLFRSLENKLLNQNDIERMVDAPNIETAFRVFNDTEYADNLLEVKPEEFKKALDDDIKQTRDLFEKVIDDKKIIQLLFLRYDFHNIKLAFKQKYSQKDLTEEESHIGTVPASSLRNRILSQAKTDLPPALEEIIRKAEKDFENNHQPHFIDSYLDKEMYRLLLKTAKKLNNNFILNFLKMQIDIANIKIFLRAKRLKKDHKWLADELIPGGRIKKEEFINILDKEIKEALNVFFFYFDNKFRRIVEKYLEDKNLWQLEKNFEDYELDYLKETKRMNYGPEIAIAYYYAKKNALRNVRLIMTGKLNGIEPSEIRERLRKLW